MSEVISGYFTESHRGLTTNPAKVASRGFVSSESVVQLPPLKPGPPSFVLEAGTDPRGMARSASVGAISPASRTFELENRNMQTMSENARLQRKVKQLQDSLAITGAKKESFKSQASRLEREFKHGRTATEHLQRELLDAKRDVEQYSKEAADAVAMMTEMRNGHIREVRLLQRGLAARGGDDKFRNRIDEVADLVDKLGRSVVQREEAIRDKTKMQAQLQKAMTDLRAITDAHSLLKKQNKQLQEKLTKAMRQVKMIEARRPQDAVDPDDSDEEFEAELLQYEKHFEILKDNAAGADVMAMSLTKDKACLEDKLDMSKKNGRSLKASVEYWKNMCEEKDVQLAEFQQHIDGLQKKEAELMAAIKQKEREIGDDVDEERVKLEAELEAAKREREEALLNADEMQKAGDQMSKAMAELSAPPKPSDRVGDTLRQAEGEYDAHRERKEQRDATTRAGQEAEAKAAEDAAEGPAEKTPEPAKDAEPKELPE